MFGRSEHCPGIIYDEAQHRSNAAKGNPTNFLWFKGNGVEESPAARAYIEQGENRVNWIHAISAVSGNRGMSYPRSTRPK